jgi:uncharacterized protein YaiI (UPF0178 family)
LTQILVDADAYPVKEEVYRVAKRYRLRVTLVANSWMQTPLDESVTLQVVGSGMDEADDWIADAATARDIVITADIPLAARCLEKGSEVLGPSGRPFTEDNIGDALTTRELMSQLRQAGAVSGGPPPFSPKDRSRFLQELDRLVHKVERRKTEGSS